MSLKSMYMHEEESANFYKEKRCVVGGCFRGDVLPFVFFGHPKTQTLLKLSTKLKLSANSLAIRHLPIRPAETVCQFELKFNSGN